MSLTVEVWGEESAAKLAVAILSPIANGKRVVLGKKGENGKHVDVGARWLDLAVHPDEQAVLKSLKDHHRNPFDANMRATLLFVRPSHRAGCEAMQDCAWSTKKTEGKLVSITLTVFVVNNQFIVSNEGMMTLLEHIGK